MMSTSSPRTAGSLRNVVMLATPILTAIVSVIHPSLAGDNVLGRLQPQIGVWLAVHLAQLVLIGLLGAVIWLLVDGLEGGAARVARAAVVPFLVFYTAFDSVVGISTGVLASLTQTLSPQEQLVAGRLVQEFWNARFLPPIGPVILVADLAWVIAMIAAAVAVRRAGASWLIVGLLAVAGIAFGIDHPFPFGTIGMLGLLLAVILLQRQGVPRASRSEAPHAV
jgi:hypothetical protein